MKGANTVHTVFNLLGSLIVIQGILLLLPLVLVFLYHEGTLLYAFLLPSLLSIVVGFLLIKLTKPRKVRIKYGYVIKNNEIYLDSVYEKDYNIKHKE